MNGHAQNLCTTMGKKTSQLIFSLDSIILWNGWPKKKSTDYLAGFGSDCIPTSVNISANGVERVTTPDVQYQFLETLIQDISALL